MSSTEGNPPQVSADEARALLERAQQVGSATTAGASWPQIATLMVIGASSSMAMVGLGLAAEGAGRLAAISVMVVFLVWLGIALAMAFVFGRSTKRGFAKRWGVAMGLWAVLWVTGVSLGSTVFAGSLVWHVAVAGVITLVTVAIAWLEARR